MLTTGLDYWKLPWSQRWAGLGAVDQGAASEERLPALHAEGMATDSLDPCGIYVGTTSGHLFYSRDNWELMVEYLPPINSVSCAVVV